MAADLSADEVSDTGTFKMATGEDPVNANRKYGAQFVFTNRALFAFSANEFPPVNDNSRAYLNRVKPFSFPVSFEGRENPRIEAAMVANELPGILAKWTAAWQRITERGGYQPTNADVQAKFEQASDQVAAWASEHLTVYAGQLATDVGIDPDAATFPDKFTTQGRPLYRAYRSWCEQTGHKPLAERRFLERVRTKLAGVRDVRRSSDRNAALNVVLVDQPEAGRMGQVTPIRG